MNRPKGLALTAILMALCNALIWATIKPGRPPYTQRMWLFFTFSICIGYLSFWFYWKGRNWARIAVLLVSFTSIVKSFQLEHRSVIPCAPDHTSSHCACDESCSRCGSLVLAEYRSSCRFLQAKPGSSAASVPRIGLRGERK
jgi:hypothetical protein